MFTLIHSSCAHVQVRPLWIGVAMLVLSVQMSEGDGERRARLLAEPQGVGGKVGVKGLAGGRGWNGGGTSHSQLRS